MKKDRQCKICGIKILTVKSKYLCDDCQKVEFEDLNWLIANCIEFNQD